MIDEIKMVCARCGRREPLSHVMAKVKTCKPARCESCGKDALERDMAPCVEQPCLFAHDRGEA